MDENYMKEFNKLRILPRDNLSKHDYIKRYFYQNEMMRKLYDSEEFSDDQLLYIFNNNTLKGLVFLLSDVVRKEEYREKNVLFVIRYSSISYIKLWKRFGSSIHWQD